MMHGAPSRSSMEEFERAARSRREDIAHKEKAIRFEMRERERRSDQAEEKQAVEDAGLIDMVLATPESVAACRIDFDSYDATTVEALMDKQEAIDRERGRIDAMLGEATLLPDGRHVFKTRNGQHVFDEHGKALAPEVIDPDSIDNAKPDWETFRAGTDAYHRLIEERQELLDYQARLDEARERLDSGDITAKELKGMKAGLAADMPDAVREKLGLETARPGSDMEREGLTGGRTVPAPLPNDMDALMRQTGLAPAPAP